MQVQREFKAVLAKLGIEYEIEMYIEMGIPACKFGLDGGRWKFRSEQVDIEDIYQAAQGAILLGKTNMHEWARRQICASTSIGTDSARPATQSSRLTMHEGQSVRNPASMASSD